MASDIPFLTQEFRSFLGCLDQTRRQIQERQSIGAGPGDLPREPGSIRERLALQLTRQVADAQREAYDSKSAAFKHAQYVMARIAEVTLDSFPWWGRGQLRPLTEDFPLPDGWATDLVVRIDQLLAADPPSAELAEIYLLALAAGLEPPRDDPKRLRQIEHRRERLITQISTVRPELAVPRVPLLFPEAYTVSQDRRPVVYLPQLGGWVAALAVVLAVLFAVSILIYQGATAPLADTLDETLKLLG
jgi:hypothetical protein